MPTQCGIFVFRNVGPGQWQDGVDGGELIMMHDLGGGMDQSAAAASRTPRFLGVQNRLA